MAVGGLEQLFEQLDFQQPHVLGAAVVTALALLLIAYLMCCRSKSGPAKTTGTKKKAKSGDKGADSGKSAPVSSQSEKEGAKSAEKKGKDKGKAKEEAPEEDKKAAKLAQKKLAQKQAEERIRAEMDGKDGKDGKKSGGAGGSKNSGKSKFDEQQEAVKQAALEAKHKEMFEKAQSRMKGASAAEVKVNKGGFGAFADSDSD